jgi:hypothetical protein
MAITLASGRRYGGPLYPIEPADDGGAVRGRTHDAAPCLDDQDDEPRGRVRHTHIYLPVDWLTPAPTRQTTHDAAPIRRPAVRRGDQAQEPEPGQLVCKLSQHGETGRWSGTDCDGRPLVITRAGDGTFEVRHASNGEEDPDTIAMQAPLSRDANAGAPGELTAGKAFEQRMSAALAPGKGCGSARPERASRLAAADGRAYRRR